LEDARADYAKLLESSSYIKASREKEVQELRLQLDAEKKRSAELEEELDDQEKQVADLRRNLSDRDKELEQLRSELSDRDKELEQLRSELSDLKQKSAAASELPEAADLLNQLKAKRKKSKTDLADLEAILEILKN
jgi:chromosome segregation ATPase